MSVAHGHTVAAYDDIMALNGFAQSVDIITFLLLINFSLFR